MERGGGPGLHMHGLMLTAMQDSRATTVMELIALAHHAVAMGGAWMDVVPGQGLKPLYSW